MAISITSRPIKNIESTSNSNWNASENPVIYGIKREDQQINFTEQGAGNAVQINLTVNLTSVISQGDSIYLGSGVYAQGGKVVTITATTILTDIPFIQNTTGGYINFRKNYRVEIDFIDPATGLSKFRKRLSVRTRPDGSLIQEVQEKSKNLLVSEDDYDYETSNFKDPNLSTGFYITLTEKYEGFDPPNPVVIDSDFPIYLTLSAKQIGDIFGSNMAQYFTSADPVSEENRAKFLTRFDEIPYWPGWPFDIQFIYSDKLKDNIVYKEEVYKDFEGNVLDTRIVYLDSSQHSGVNRLLFEEDVPEGTECIEVTIKNQGVQPEYEPTEYNNLEYNT